MKSNSVMCSVEYTYLTSSGAAQGNGGCFVTPANWRSAIALYAARKLVVGSWINDKDEYLAPHAESTPTYEQWINDCHVYTILQSSNNCTAMRNVSYKGTPWTIHNHLFWMSHAQALDALDAADTQSLYRDCKQHPSRDVFGNDVDSTPDPYMARALASGPLPLSTEAWVVLDKLNALWTMSLAHREGYAASHPDLHLMAWDAGLYQCKHLFRDLFPTEWADLQVAFKALSDKLRPGVYEHGFLFAYAGLLKRATDRG